MKKSNGLFEFGKLYKSKKGRIGILNTGRNVGVMLIQIFITSVPIKKTMAGYKIRTIIQEENGYSLEVEVSIDEFNNSFRKFI